MELTVHEAAQIRVWPSLPEERMPGWHFNDEKTLLVTQVDLAVQRFGLSREHINTLIHFLVDRCSEMAGEMAPEPADLADSNFYVADTFSIKGSPFLQRAWVWGRVPGLGWVSILIEADVLLGAAQSLMADKPALPSTSKH